MRVAEPEDPMIDDEAETDDDFEECVSSDGNGTSTVKFTDPVLPTRQFSELIQRC